MFNPSKNLLLIAVISIFICACKGQSDAVSGKSKEDIALEEKMKLLLTKLDHLKPGIAIYFDSTPVLIVESVNGDNITAQLIYCTDCDAPRLRETYRGNQQKESKEFVLKLENIKKSIIVDATAFKNRYRNKPDIDLLGNGHLYVITDIQDTNAPQLEVTKYVYDYENSQVSIKLRNIGSPASIVRLDGEEDYYSIISWAVKSSTAMPKMMADPTVVFNIVGSLEDRNGRYHIRPILEDKSGNQFTYDILIDKSISYVKEIPKIENINADLYRKTWNELRNNIFAPDPTNRSQILYVQDHQYSPDKNFIENIPNGRSLENFYGLAIEKGFHDGGVQTFFMGASGAAYLNRSTSNYGCYGVYNDVASIQIAAKNLMASAAKLYAKSYKEVNFKDPKTNPLPPPPNKVRCYFIAKEGAFQMIESESAQEYPPTFDTCSDLYMLSENYINAYAVHLSNQGMSLN